MLAPAESLADDDLRRWRSCVRRFWLQRHAPAEPLVLEPEHGTDRMVDGAGSPVALRASYPGLVSLPPPADEAGWQAALEATARHLQDTARQDEAWGLAGACLATDDGLRVRIDLVTRGAFGLRLFKLRHATAGSEADVDTVALWLHAAARQGLRVQSAGLMLIDTGFVYPGHGLYAGLYREVDLAPVLGTRPVAEWIVGMRRCDRGALPAVPLGAPCGGGCEQLSRCALPAADARLADPEASLEIVGRELAAELRAEGHTDLRSVPLERLPGSRQRRAARAVQLGHDVLDAGAAPALRSVAGPRHWLRFETIGFAVPPWAGTQPYQVLPFQWSCDVERADGSIAHHGFLAGPDADPRRAFAQSLVQALRDEGPLFAYNAGFERNRIRELANRFEDLAEPLMALLPRIVDLFVLLREHYYHPAMAGSWSARSVFQAVAPEAGAHDFECEWQGRHIVSPLEAYAASLQRGVPAADRQRLHEALRAHGQRHGAALRALTAVLESAPH